MKTIFDTQVRKALIERITQLNTNKVSQWGKMNIYQMINHCILWDEMAQSKRVHKRTLLGKLFGKMALLEFVGDESPFRKNVPTISELKIKETNGDIDELKENWIHSIEAYKDCEATFVHPFFGNLNKDQLGVLAYKHNDHHLRQFGV